MEGMENHDRSENNAGIDVLPLLGGGVDGAGLDDSKALIDSSVFEMLSVLEPIETGDMSSGPDYFDSLLLGSGVTEPVLEPPAAAPPVALPAAPVVAPKAATLLPPSIAAPSAPSKPKAITPAASAASTTTPRRATPWRSSGTSVLAMAKKRSHESAMRSAQERRARKYGNSGTALDDEPEADFDDNDSHSHKRARVDDLASSDDDAGKASVDAEEDKAQRRERRLQKNRDTAYISRIRRRVYTRQLEELVNQTEGEKAELARENDQLRTDLQRLEEELRRHVELSDTSSPPPPPAAAANAKDNAVAQNTRSSAARQQARSSHVKSPAKTKHDAAKHADDDGRISDVCSSGSNSMVDFLQDFVAPIAPPRSGESSNAPAVRVTMFMFALLFGLTMPGGWLSQIAVPGSGGGQVASPFASHAPWAASSKMANVASSSASASSSERVLDPNLWLDSWRMYAHLAGDGAGTGVERASGGGGSEVPPPRSFAADKAASVAHAVEAVRAALTAVVPPSGDAAVSKADAPTEAVAADAETPPEADVAGPAANAEVEVDTPSLPAEPPSTPAGSAATASTEELPDELSSVQAHVRKDVSTSGVSPKHEMPAAERPMAARV